MRKTAFMFCGAGAQYPGMMKELYREYPECKRVFDEADALLKKKLSSICFSGTEEELNNTSTMIPAIYTADMAAYEALSSKGISPDYMLGFSLGEWAALTASEAISFRTGLPVVRFRAEAMERSAPEGGGGMAVILKQPNKHVEELCKRVEHGAVFPANYNYEGQVTVSGDEDGLSELERIAGEEHVIFKRLSVFVPSHCILMKQAMEELRGRLVHISFSKPFCPVLSNATAEPETDEEMLKENVIVQLIKPVLFEQSVIRLLNEGVDCFAELGPGRTLSKFVTRIAKKTGADCKVANVEDIDSLNRTLELLG